MLPVFVHVNKCELAVNIGHLRRVGLGCGADMLRRWQSWDCNSDPFCSVLSGLSLPLPMSVLCFMLFSVFRFPHYKIKFLT